MQGMQQRLGVYNRQPLFRVVVSILKPQSTHLQSSILVKYFFVSLTVSLVRCFEPARTKQTLPCDLHRFQIKA